MKIGVSHIPSAPDLTVALAALADAAGIDVFGVADSPHLYGGMYPTVQHLLAHTDRIPVGPCVTNPVTRHPSVHGADLATLETLFPSRTWAAIGAGDSAVHSLGLTPATGRQVAEAIEAVRQRVGVVPGLWMAASGPRTAAAVPASASAVLLGGGLDRYWLSGLGGAARRAAGHDLERWAFCVAHLVAHESQVAEARAEVRASVLAVARHGLGRDAAGRGVPAELVADVDTLRREYDFAAHARRGGANAELLARHPEAETYLFDRFALVGTPEQVRRRVDALAASGAVDGLVLSTTVPDPQTHVRLIADALVQS